MNILESVRHFEVELYRRKKENSIKNKYQDCRNNAFSKNSLKNSLTILVLLSQQPSDTGSGISTREMVKEMVLQGHNPHLLAAHYQTIKGRDLGLNDKNVHTILFKIDSSINDRAADINFKIPGMSLKMPYPNTPYKELTESQLVEYFNAFYIKIQQLVKKIKPDIIHVNHLWFLPPIAQLAAPWLPVVATARGTDYLLLRDHPVFSQLVIKGAQSLDKVISLSHDLKELVVETYGVSEDRLIVIPNGYDDLIFYFNNQMNNSKNRKGFLEAYGLNIPTEATIVLAVAKFYHIKGLHYLIRAASLYTQIENRSPIYTIIVGNGNQDQIKEYKNLIKKLHLCNYIKLVGKVNHTEVAKFMNIAKVLVVPSLFEGFSRVALEGLATGLKLVATDVGGIRQIVKQELIEQGFTELIRPIKMYSGIQPSISHEDAFIKELARAISEVASSYLTQENREKIAISVSDNSWRNRVKQVIEVYNETIQRKALCFPQ